jgi:hypothetical protein
MTEGQGAIIERGVGGTIAAKKSCKHCYGRGWEGVRVEKTEDGWQLVGKAPCRCLRTYPGKKYIPRGWTPIAKETGVVR